MDDCYRAQGIGGVYRQSAYCACGSGWDCYCGWACSLLYAQVEGGVGCVVIWLALLGFCTPVMRCGLYSVVSCRDWPRRATHFLCFAKESKQRKATAANCPSGSRKSERQSGKRNNSPSLRSELKQISLLFPLRHSLFRQFTAERPKAKPNVKVKSKTEKQNPETKLPASVAMPFPIDPEMNDLEVRCCF
jgi:hypothetical protein